MNANRDPQHLTMDDLAVPSPPPTAHARRGRGRLRRSVAALSAVAVAGAGAWVVPAVTTSGEAATAADASTVLEQADRWRGSWAGPRTYGGYPGPAAPWPGASRADTATAALDVADATADQSVGMVLISSTVEFGAGEAAGTGMVVSSDGIVVTNHHVVESSTDLEVTVASTGRTYAAEVLGADAAKDVAVLRLVDASALDTVVPATDSVELGDAVTAVGDAGGDGGALTAAEGTVTATRAPVTVSNEDGTESTLRGLVEVDADIVSGDSGGALLDATGAVVGMNVAASSGAVDITGYAIPVARVLRTVDAVLAGEETGSLTLGYDAFLGVELAVGASEPTLAGVVAGTAAAEAGLAAGDTVTAVGGTAVRSADELSAAVAARAPGEQVVLTWTGATGVEGTATVTLGRAPVA
ncbi:S1C family serine protease [Nocardioides sp. SYSU DS0663]|uniref:S1C family serine protease n=1 Tax=Nocardioides sp. SYSU DS0663 TaxID=3416445 RepID=UPI003F4B49B9